MPSIVSASRRTDIPAFHADWFAERIRAGTCSVANPFNPNQVRRVDLRPEAVDGIVFWTRRPDPLIPFLDLLAPYPTYFQITLTGMDRVLEPHLPPEAESLASFNRLSGIVGPARVVWRFDPLLVTSLTPVPEIIARFRRLAGKLEGKTERVVISLAQLYTKARRRLAKRGELEVVDLHAPEASGIVENLLGEIGRLAKEHGLRAMICASENDYTHLGIEPGKCIDPKIFNLASGLDLDPPKDRSQRPACNCAASIDIGAYNTCTHGCIYCYAVTSQKSAAANRGNHDPGGEGLINR